MVKQPESVKAYLEALPGERRRALEAVRRVIRKNLPKGYEEGIQYGMIGYYVPHRLYPAGYHCNPDEPLPFASIGSQKNHMAIYLMCIYSDEAHRERFISEWKASGKKLDMGKSCVRFKKIEDVPLEVVGDVIARVPVKEYVSFYENALSVSGKRTGGNMLSKKTLKKVTKKTSSGKTGARKKAASKKPALSKKAGSKKAGSKMAASKKKGVTKKAGALLEKLPTKKATRKKAPKR